MSAPSEVFELSNGTKFPKVGLGTWKSPKAKTIDAVKAAVTSGYRMIDTANDYGNETSVGQAIKELLEQRLVLREDLFIQSKLWNSNHRKEHVKPDLMATLEDLKLDYVDSYVLHWPQACPATGTGAGVCREPHTNQPTPASEGPSMFPVGEDGYYVSDDDCHFVETWKAMEDLVDEGLCKTIGLSNFNIEQIKEILSICRIRPTVLQNECHPYLQQNEILEFCKKEGIQFQGYSPLGSNDSPFRKPGQPKLFEEPDLKKIGEKHGKSIAQIVLRWNVQRGVSVVPKSVTPSRISENYNIFDFELDEEDMKAMTKFDRGWRHCTFPHSAKHPDYPFKEELGKTIELEKAPEKN